nr:type I secretion system permease/ATPase [Caulobacter hibisci]
MRAALRACRTHFMSAALFSGLINLLYLVPSIFMLQVYDRVVPTRGGGTLVILCLVLAVSLIVFAALDAVRMRLLMLSSMRLEKRAAGDILHRILGAGQATPLQRLQAMRDFDTLRNTLTGPAIIAIFDAPWAPIYIIICYMLHPMIGLLALLSSLLLIGVAVLSDYATRNGVAEASKQANINYQLQDFSIQSAEVARALGLRNALVTRHLSDRAEVAQIQGEVANTSGSFLAVTKFLRMLFQSMALALGAWLAIKQEISAGAIFAASLILGRALQPVEQILNALKNVLSARDAYRNLLEFCELPDAAAPRTTLPKPQGRFDVINATVEIPGLERPILNDLTFSVMPGEIIGLVGPSGAGKSTLLRMMAGAIEPTSGEIRIDGAKLDDWDRETLGRNMGYMPQSPTLFPASVHANISRFRSYLEPAGPDLDRRVVNAAQMAGAHELILRFAQGYQTSLTNREGGLSAGQRQVVALARALFDSPTILLLDEPNAHLDSGGEARLVETIEELRQRNATVIVSSHRTGILRSVDKIMVLRDGEIQVFGDRDDIFRTAASAPVPAPPSPEPASDVGQLNQGDDGRDARQGGA